MCGVDDCFGRSLSAQFDFVALFSCCWCWWSFSWNYFFFSESMRRVVMVRCCKKKMMMWKGLVFKDYFVQKEKLYPCVLTSITNEWQLYEGKDIELILGRFNQIFFIIFLILSSTGLNQKGHHFKYWKSHVVKLCMGQRCVQSDPTTPCKSMCTDVQPPNVIQCLEHRVCVHNVWVDVWVQLKKEQKIKKQGEE